MLYTGYTASSYFGHSGSGHNFVCLHDDPEHPPGATTANNNGAGLYGTEYRNSGNSGLDKSLFRGAACAVCQLVAPGTTHVQWGRSQSWEGMLAPHMANAQMSFTSAGVR